MLRDGMGLFIGQLEYAAVRLPYLRVRVPGA